ncbi:MAG: hypothetical protein KatS3mg010_2151 [Acidimicrobiia bacterium]|nr:MAG: hypothetical protein KatS3mg010_2151 [Acidimicrobiia bacterium]
MLHGSGGSDSIVSTPSSGVLIHVGTPRPESASGRPTPPGRSGHVTVSVVTMPSSRCDSTLAALLGLDDVAHQRVVARLEVEHAGAVLPGREGLDLCRSAPRRAGRTRRAPRARRAAGPRARRRGSPRARAARRRRCPPRTARPPRPPPGSTGRSPTRRARRRPSRRRRPASPTGAHSAATPVAEPDAEPDPRAARRTRPRAARRTRPPSRSPCRRRCRGRRRRRRPPHAPSTSANAAMPINQSLHVDVTPVPIRAVLPCHLRTSGPRAQTRPRQQCRHDGDHADPRAVQHPVGRRALPIVGEQRAPRAPRAGARRPRSRRTIVRSPNTACATSHA